MTFTYLPATDIGRVRRTVPGEKSSLTAQLTDEEIQSYLVDENGEAVNWRLGAAEALEDIASDQSMVLKITSSLGFSVNGVAVAQDLRNRAGELRRQVEEGLSGDGIDIVVRSRESLI